MKHTRAVDNYTKEEYTEDLAKLTPNQKVKLNIDEDTEVTVELREKIYDELYPKQPKETLEERNERVKRALAFQEQMKEEMDNAEKI